MPNLEHKPSLENWVWAYLPQNKDVMNSNLSLLCFRNFPSRRSNIRSQPSMLSPATQKAVSSSLLPAPSWYAPIHSLIIWRDSDHWFDIGWWGTKAYELHPSIPAPPRRTRQLLCLQWRIPSRLRRIRSVARWGSGEFYVFGCVWRISDGRYLDCVIEIRIIMRIWLPLKRSETDSKFLKMYQTVDNDYIWFPNNRFEAMQTRRIPQESKNDTAWFWRPRSERPYAWPGYQILNSLSGLRVRNKYLKIWSFIIHEEGKISSRLLLTTKLERQEQESWNPFSNGCSCWTNQTAESVTSVVSQNNQLISASCLRAPSQRLLNFQIFSILHTTPGLIEVRIVSVRWNRVAIIIWLLTRVIFIELQSFASSDQAIYRPRCYFCRSSVTVAVTIQVVNFPYQKHQIKVLTSFGLLYTEPLVEPGCCDSHRPLFIRTPP